MLENHVTSLELSKRLKELGVKQESLFYWVDKKGWALQDRKPIYCNIETCECVEISYLSAFLASELGEVLGTQAQVWRHPKGWVAEHFLSGDKQFVENSMPDAIAKCLIYLAKKGIIKPNEIN